MSLGLVSGCNGTVECDSGFRERFALQDHLFEWSWGRSRMLGGVLGEDSGLGSPRSRSFRNKYGRERLE